MTLVTKISEADYFPAALTCCSHLGKTIANIKHKLSPVQLDLFRQTCFGSFLDVDLVFNGPLIHYILLREVEESRPDTLSFKLLGEKVSFGHKEFDLITGLRHRTRNVNYHNRDGVRLRVLYLNDRVNMKGKELDELFPTMEFENDEDATKIAIFYFIELAMMGRERKQFMDWTLLGFIDDWELLCNYNWSRMIFDKTFKSLQNALKGKAVAFKEKPTNEKKPETYSLYGFPFAFQVWAYETISSMTGRVAKKRSDNAIPRIVRWSCSHSPTYTILSSLVFGLPPARVTLQLKPIAEEEAHMDRLLDTPRPRPIPEPYVREPGRSVHDAVVDELVQDPPTSTSGVDRGRAYESATPDTAGPSEGRATYRCTKHLERIEARLKSMETDMKDIKGEVVAMKVYLETDVKGELTAMKEYLETDVKGELTAIKEYLRLLTKGKSVDTPQFSESNDGSTDEGEQFGHNGGEFDNPDDTPTDGGGDKEGDKDRLEEGDKDGLMDERDKDGSMEEGDGGGPDHHDSQSQPQMIMTAPDSLELIDPKSEHVELLFEDMIPFSQPPTEEFIVRRGSRKRGQPWLLKSPYMEIVYERKRRKVKVYDPMHKIPTQLDNKFYEWLDDPRTDNVIRKTVCILKQGMISKFVDTQ